MNTVTPVSDMLTEIRSREFAPAQFLLISDVHYDSPKCQRDIFFRHLDQAAEDGAMILCFGDFFDVMAGQHDRRRSKALLRPEYVSGNYIQDVVMKTAEDLKPYAHLFAVMSDGNHETAILKNQEVDIVKWLCYELKREGSPVIHMGYHGFVRFVTSQPDGSSVRSTLLYFHHGKWGGVVSKGVQSVARFSSVVPQANIIVSGHTHDAWQVEQPQYHLKKRHLRSQEVGMWRRL